MPQETTPSKEVFRITCKPDGTSTGVYADTSVLKGEVRRASNVEFNNDVGLWEARLNDGTLIATDSNRQACIAKEVEWLNAALAAGKAVPHGPGEQSNIMAIETLFKRLVDQVRDSGIKILTVPELKPETERYHHMMDKIRALDIQCATTFDNAKLAELRQLVAVYWEAQEAGFPPLPTMPARPFMNQLGATPVEDIAEITFSVRQSANWKNTLVRIECIKTRDEKAADVVVRDPVMLKEALSETAALNAIEG